MYYIYTKFAVKYLVFAGLLLTGNLPTLKEFVTATINSIGEICICMITQA